MSAGCRYFLCSECCKKKILDAKLDQWVNITDRIGPHYKADVVYKWLISKLCRFDPFLILRKNDVNIHICVMDEVSFCQRFLERCVWTNVSGYSQREYKFTALSATEFGRIYVSAVTVSSQMSSGVCALSLLVDEVLNNCRSNDE